MFDVIVVGARCAGSPTAMLLARKGYRVLLVDKARFPSDVVNGYCLQQHAVERLRRWSLLDKLRNSNCPPLLTITFDFGDFTLSGSPPPAADVFEAYAPRRIVLDKILVDAAVEAGAELREEFAVDALLRDHDRVTGIRSHSKTGAAITESASIVIGADGPNSIVARSAKARTYNVKPTLTCWYFSHWSGVPAKGVEFYLRSRRALIACYTNDGLTVVLTGCPYDDFFSLRTDVEANYFKSLELAPQFAERVRSGKQEDRLVGTVNTANFLRRPYGSGWALVGDAGYHKDPATAQGIADSFRDAELLSEAIDAGFSGRKQLDDALARYEEERNSTVMPMYDFTAQLADLAKPPPPEMQRLLRALRGNQTQTNRFLGTWAGTVSIPEFFAPENLQRIKSESGYGRRVRETCQVDITFHRRSWRSEETLPSLAHRFPGFERAASGAIYRRALARGRGKFLGVLSRAVDADAGLLQRPVDRAISGSIGLGVRELLLVRVQEARNVALGGFPAEFVLLSQSDRRVEN